MFHSQQLPQPPQELHCKLGCHLRLLPMRWNWSPQKAVKIAKWGRQLPKNWKVCGSCVNQKSYEIIAQYRIKNPWNILGFTLMSPILCEQLILRVTSLLPPHWFVASFAHEMWAIWGPGVTTYWFYSATKWASTIYISVKHRAYFPL